MITYCANKARNIKICKGRQRVYAVVLNKRGRIVGESANSYTKTHPRNKDTLRPYLHAEQRAILKARGQGVKLVVARVTKDGELAYSKPCEVCEMWIRESGIKSVEYSV